MKILQNVLALVTLAFLSIGLFSSQKAEGPLKSAPKHDTVKTREIQHNQQKVDLPVYATLENINFLMKQQKAVVFHYGFAPVYNPEFEKKYGVKIMNQGCVIMPAEQELHQKNNLNVSNFLTKKFGDVWKQELGFLPVTGN